jgi:uncharacterized membrane protein (DUF485 family)
MTAERKATTLAEKKQPMPQAGQWAAVLGQLKFPLVFFGLALLVTEAAYTTVLLQNKVSEKIAITYGWLMCLLFLTTIVIVGLLTLIAPKHLMLLPHEERKTTQLKKGTEAILDYLKLKSPAQSDKLALIEKVIGMLADDSGAKT